MMMGDTYFLFSLFVFSKKFFFFKYYYIYSSKKYCKFGGFLLGQMSCVSFLKYMKSVAVGQSGLVGLSLRVVGREGRQGIWPWLQA